MVFLFLAGVTKRGDVQTEGLEACLGAFCKGERLPVFVSDAIGWWPPLGVGDQPAALFLPRIFLFPTAHKRAKVSAFQPPAKQGQGVSFFGASLASRRASNLLGPRVCRAVDRPTVIRPGLVSLVFSFFRPSSREFALRANRPLPISTLGRGMHRRPEKSPGPPEGAT